MAIKKSGSFLLAGIVALGVSTAAHADLIGSTVTVTGEDLCSSAGATGPTGCSIFGGPETKVISSGGTTFLSPAIANGIVTVNGNQLIYMATRFCCTGAPDFNGFEFQIAGAPAIASISVDPSTTLGPATNNYADGFLLLGGNTVWMDLNGLNGNAGQMTVLDLRFASSGVPEPGTLGLAALGVAGIAAFRRSRRRR
jgi:PEP-CTERM motif